MNSYGLIFFVAFIVFKVDGVSAYNIKYIYNDSNTVIGIAFEDNTNKEIKRQLLKDISPYQNLEYPVLSINNASLNIYDIPHTNAFDVLNRFIIDKDINLEYGYLVNLATINTMSHVNIENGYAIITFNAYLASEDGDYVAVKSIMQVYNDRGELEFVCPETNDGYNVPVITSSGDYIAYLTASNSVHSGYSFFTERKLIIYNLIDQEREYEFHASLCKSLYKPFVEGNKLIFEISNENGYIYNVYSSGDGEYYYRHFTNDERQKVLAIDSIGISIKGAMGDDVYLKYTEDFQIGKYIRD